MILSLDIFLFVHESQQRIDIGVTIFHTSFLTTARGARGLGTPPPRTSRSCWGLPCKHGVLSCKAFQKEPLNMLTTAPSQCTSILRGPCCAHTCTLGSLLRSTSIAQSMHLPPMLLGLRLYSNTSEKPPVWCSNKQEPTISYIDDEIFSSKKTVHIWHTPWGWFVLSVVETLQLFRSALLRPAHFGNVIVFRELVKIWIQLLMFLDKLNEWKQTWTFSLWVSFDLFLTRSISWSKNTFIENKYSLSLCTQKSNFSCRLSPPFGRLRSLLRRFHNSGFDSPLQWFLLLFLLLLLLTSNDVRKRHPVLNYFFSTPFNLNAPPTVW